VLFLAKIKECNGILNAALSYASRRHSLNSTSRTRWHDRLDMPASERHALLHLIAIGGELEPRRRLLDRAGSARAAYEAGLQVWREAGLDLAQCAALRSPHSPSDALKRWCDESPQHHVLGWHEADYPALLREMPSPPLALFVIGDPSRLWHPSIAIVGSRRPSAGGRENAYTFAVAMARSGLAVISGLAAGIDGAAHRAALDAGGLTIAVLGTGIDAPYPRVHAELYRQVACSGVVVSEYPPGTPARRGQFPARNRIIAGLTLGTLVVEAALRSGALITARLASEAGREVFAIPGSIHNPMAKGCHRLIRQGAALVENADDVTQALAPLAARLGQSIELRLQAEPKTAVAAPEHPDARRIWHALGHDPVDLDQLGERTGLTAATLSSLLLVMELEGRVSAVHGRYCLIS